MSDARKARLWIAVRIVLALAGLAGVALLVRDIGVDALRAAIVPAVASRATLGPRGRGIPPLAMYGAHLVAYAVMGVAPAGRATSEAVKATLLARWVGGPAAAALGTTNQANVLISSGTYTLFAAVAAYVTTGPSVLTWALAVHFVMMNASGLVLRGAARYERFGAWLARRLPKIAEHAREFHAASRETALVPAKPVLAMMGGRALQSAHFGVLAMAVGLSPGVLGALAVHGVYLVVAAIGVLVPGQLGASEGGFALAAGVLGAREAQAMSIALLSHAIQLVLVVAGLIVLALWRGRSGAPPG